MQNQQYLDLLDSLNDRYRKKTDLAVQGKNKIIISEDDLKRLSRFELNTLRSIGNMFGIFSQTSGDISLNDVVEIMSKLARHKTDPEKVYLMGLFFPEKLKNKNIHQVNPFP
jgi:hypothetical protein